MSGSSATAASDRWAGYLDLATGTASCRRLVLELLNGVREQAGASGAALYLHGDGGLGRELVTGTGSFPPRAAAAADLGPGRLSLGEAEVLLGGGSPEAVGEGGLRVALAAAVRALLLEKQLKRQRFDAAYRGVELEALYDVGLAIASTLNLDELAEEILLRAVSLLDARRGALYFVDAAGYRLARTFGGEARSRMEFDEPLARHLLGKEKVGQQDLLPGAEHLLALPIEVEGKPRGLLVVADKESRHGVGPFAESDRRTLALFANQAAIALENAYLHRQALEKERLEREAELAAEIQRRLLPASLPHVEGVDLAGWSRPARQVGGDYYDILPLPQGHLATVVADVSGKGMPAALMVSTLYSALHLLMDGNPPGPALAERLNHHIFQSSAPNKFITLVAAEIDPASGDVSYINAGHNPALWMREDGSVRELPPGGLPLGLFAGGRYEGGNLTLARGDLLCFFSDGITEAESPQDEEFGEGRLVDVLREHASRPLPEIVRAVEGAASRFAHGMPQGDDQTLLLLRKM